VLSVPVVGVVMSMILLGERLTLGDVMGFALIFAASACVLLSSQAPAPKEAPQAT
jgi:threonine/homoserine efflux transporter RhtA